MLAKYPLQNGYWADKRADMSKIRVPAYVLASYSTGLHTLGSMRGYEEIPHENKWFVGALDSQPPSIRVGTQDMPVLMLDVQAPRSPNAGMV